MVTYRGLPGPVIRDHLSREDSRALYAPGTTFQIGRIEMVANTGTYVDAPFHRWEDGADLAGLSLDILAGRPGICISAPHARGLAIGEDFLEGKEVEGRAVLFCTGWASRWGTAGYPSGFRFYAVPVKVVGMGTFPVRAFAEVADAPKAPS